MSQVASFIDESAIYAALDEGKRAVSRDTVEAIIQKAWQAHGLTLPVMANIPQFYDFDVRGRGVFAPMTSMMFRDFPARVPGVVFGGAYQMVSAATDVSNWHNAHAINSEHCGRPARTSQALQILKGIADAGMSVTAIRCGIGVLSVWEYGLLRMRPFCPAELDYNGYFP